MQSGLLFQRLYISDRYIWNAMVYRSSWDLKNFQMTPLYTRTAQRTAFCLYLYFILVLRTSPSYTESAREGLGTHAHVARISGMYHAPCFVYLVTANRINVVGRLGRCTYMYFTAARMVCTQHNSHSCGVVPWTLWSDWCPEIPGRIHAGMYTSPKTLFRSFSVGGAGARD